MPSKDHLAHIRKIATDSGIFSLWEGDALYLDLTDNSADIKPLTDAFGQIKDCKKSLTWLAYEGGSFGDALKLEITDPK